MICKLRKGADVSLINCTSMSSRIEPVTRGSVLVHLSLRRCFESFWLFKHLFRVFTLAPWFVRLSSDGVLHHWRRRGCHEGAQAHEHKWRYSEEELSNTRLYCPVLVILEQHLLYLYCFWLSGTMWASVLSCPVFCCPALSYHVFYWQYSVLYHLVLCRVPHCTSLYCLELVSCPVLYVLLSCTVLYCLVCSWFCGVLSCHCAQLTQG